MGRSLSTQIQPRDALAGLLPRCELAWASLTVPLRSQSLDSVAVVSRCSWMHEPHALSHITVRLRRVEIAGMHACMLPWDQARSSETYLHTAQAAQVPCSHPLPCAAQCVAWSAARLRVSAVPHGHGVYAFVAGVVRCACLAASALLPDTPRPRAAGGLHALRVSLSWGSQWASCISSCSRLTGSEF